MRNIKRILMVMLLLSMAIAATVGLSSCGNKDPHVHEFAETVLKEATCTTVGEVKLTCECGYSYNEEIKAKGHTVVVDAGKPATCTEGGLSDGSHCSECGVVIERQLETSPLGHKPGDAATCTEAQVCANGCGKVFAPATGHFTTTEATCDKAEVCEYCGAEVTPALGHNSIVMEAVAPGCFTTGRTEGEYCDRCHTVIVPQEIIPANAHELIAVVTPPTCFNEGYTTYSCECGLYSHVDDYTPVAHIWEILEDEDGFVRHCNNSCDATERIDAPVADSYKATIDNGFTSDRANSLDFKFVQYGAEGIYTNGSISKDTEYVGGIGGLDKGANYIGYEFVMEKPGTIDIIWEIAGNYWQSGVGNAGLDDMAKYMAITIDGKPVDISGLALPKGDGTTVNAYWNIQKFVLEGVVLDAGVHTFYCDINPNDDTNTETTEGGLNVGTFTIKSSKPVAIRPIPTVTSAKVELDGNKVYYVLTLNNCVYTVDEIEFFDASTVYPIASFETDANGVTTLKIDITDFNINHNLNPHLRFGEFGINYLNGANANGDVRGESVEYTAYQYVSLGDKNFVVYNNWEMPAVKVYGKTMLNTAYDIVVENGKPILLLTYTCIGFDPATAEFFDGSRKLSYTFTQDGTTVVYHIDLSSSTSDFYFHLRINGQGWNGKDNKAQSNGDVLAPGYTGKHEGSWKWLKEVEVDGVKYKLFIVWSMLVLGH